MEARHGEGDDSLERLRREIADLRASRERLVLAGDADRRRLERRLHGGVQQDLVALAVELQLVRQALDSSPDDARRLLDEACVVLERALHGTALLAERIHPSLLGESGLAAALRAAVEGRSVSVSVDLVAGGEYPPEVARTAFWCCVDVVEQLEPDQRATITVRDADGPLTFEVVGRSSDRTSDDLLAAFESLGDRVEALSGRLTLERGPADGVSVRGSLPLSR